MVRDNDEGEREREQKTKNRKENTEQNTVQILTEWAPCVAVSGRKTQRETQKNAQHITEKHEGRNDGQCERV